MPETPHEAVKREKDEELAAALRREYAPSLPATIPRANHPHCRLRSDGDVECGGGVRFGRRC